MIGAMKLFILAFDFFIAVLYLTKNYIAAPDSFTTVLLLMLFFLAFRILALSLHPLIGLANLALLWALRDFFVGWLIVPYVFYVGVSLYLFKREKEHQELRRENTRLMIESRTLRRYRQMQENYEEQLALNLRLDERRQIAQQIHDLLGHTLTAAILQLEAADNLMTSDPGKARQMLERSTELLRSGVDQIRQSVRQMRHDTKSLPSVRLQTILERLGRNSDLQTQFNLTGESERIGPTYWRILAENLQEAAGNTLRHAHASRLSVELNILPGVVRMEVSDDGVGCPRPAEGMGLSGMRERTEEAGGSLLIDGRNGMRLTTLLPLKGEKDDQTCPH